MNYLIQARWGDKVTCAFCKHDKIYHLQGKFKRYKCAKCHKHFSAIKGTIFENSPIPLPKWFMAMYLFMTHKKGISSVQLSRDIDVTQKTAWFMLQRIRFLLRGKTVREKLRGLVQIDETFVGGKNKNRHRNKKFAKCQGRSFKDKTPVVGFLCEGKVRCVVVNDTDNANLHPVVLKNVEENSIIVTDEWKPYVWLGRNYYWHEVVEHKKNRYSNDNGFSTNGIEGAWSHLKRMIIGVYHQVSKKHLQRYCDEFAYRFNTRTMSDSERFAYSFQWIERRIKYKHLIRIHPT